jgi:hypothetical protein
MATGVLDASHDARQARLQGMSCVGVVELLSGLHLALQERQTLSRLGVRKHRLQR